MPRYHLQLIFCLMLMGLALTPLRGQMYTDAAGLRGGTSATLSYKKFVSAPLALEAIVGAYDYDFFGVAVLLQTHKELGRRLQWYWGVGPAATFRRDFNALGVMGALGLDLSFEAVPIDITLDWTPRVRIKEGSRWFFASAGVGLRYIIQY